MKNNGFARQKGVAIVIVLISLMFLAGVALGFVFWIMSVSKHNVVKRTYASDIYHSELGHEKAVEKLRSDSSFAAPYLDDVQGDTTTYQYFIDDTTVTVRIRDDF